MKLLNDILAALLAPKASGGFEDEMHAEDNVEIILRGPDGSIKDVRCGHNLLTTVGKEKLAERGVMASPATEGPKYIGVGSGSTAAVVGNTALETQISTRKEATTRSVSGAVGTLKKVLAAGECTGEIKEAGTFSASETGTMYSRIVFSVINKGAEDSLEIVWTLTQA